MSPRKKSQSIHAGRSPSSSGSRVPSPVIHIGYALPRRGIPAPASFRQWVEAALAGAKHPGPSELSIRIVGAREGFALNRRYRGKDHATNVLSFATNLPRGVASSLLGDIVICAPVVAREAREQGKPPRNHFAHLTVHGVLHLLGYEHQGARQAARMEGLETRILASLGMPDPYLQQEAGTGSRGA